MKMRQQLRGRSGGGQPNADSVSVVSNSLSQVSVTSSYRHDPNSQFSPSAPQPQPVLTSDASHKPKTRGSLGVLVVGVGGANGTTMLAGILANRMNVDWRGPKGEPMTPNYYGCITQLDERGVHGGVGYRNVVKGLADASMAAVGGWVSRLNEATESFRLIVTRHESVVLIENSFLSLVVLHNNHQHRT